MFGCRKEFRNNWLTFLKFGGCFDQNGRNWNACNSHNMIGLDRTGQMSFLIWQDRTPKFARLEWIGTCISKHFNKYINNKKMKKKIERNFFFILFFYYFFLFLTLRRPGRKTFGFRTVRILTIWLDGMSGRALRYELSFQSKT